MINGPKSCGFWTVIAMDDGRYFVYSPRFGKLYLISKEALTDFNFSLLGLKNLNFSAQLDDPSFNVLHQFDELSRSSFNQPDYWLRSLYYFFHFFRRYIPFRPMLGIVKGLGVQHPADNRLSITEIAKTVFAIEQTIGLSNCYPRAFITAVLLLRSGYDCELTIGTLSPTQLLHAWCSTGGDIPYEPVTEHFLYQPLIINKFQFNTTF